MTATYGWDLAGVVAVYAAVGLVVRVLIDPRRSLVAAARRAVAWLDSRTADRIVKAMAVIALVVSMGLLVKHYQLTNCLARYNEQSNASQRARADAADTDRAAQDKLFLQIADDPRHAFDKVRAYNISRAAADAQRASNPIPPPPSETCG